jgi:hypothetical protein
MNATDVVFSWRRTALLAIAFVGAMVAAHLLAFEARDTWWPRADVPGWWPVGVFFSRWGEMGHWGRAVGFGAVSLFAYELLSRWATRRGTPVELMLTAGVALIVLTNLMQGPVQGLARPVAGWEYGGLQYYHDALGIESPWRFLSQFNALQPGLLTHGKTHPPGAPLVYWALHQVFREPWAEGLVLTIAATALAGGSVYAVIGRHAGASIAQTGLWVYLCLPVTQVYFCSSLDALIAALMVAAVAAVFVVRNRVAAGLVAGVLVFSISSLTFAFLFTLPVLLLSELWLHRSLYRSSVWLATFVGLHAWLAAATGLDYVEAFRFASHSENPGGYMLLEAPGNFLLTRVESVLEIVLFLGPFAGALAWRGLVHGRHLTARPLVVLGWLGVGTLAAMLATGAFRTAETARVAAFVYPFVIFAAAAWLEQHVPGASARRLGRLCFVQAVLMQLAGDYFW